MKRLLLITLLGIGVSLFTMNASDLKLEKTIQSNEGEGIQFSHGSWDEIMALAKKSNKMIFVDCYTSWCGPCKQLSKEVFPVKEVGAYFNQHFVSVKIDMEKGEGKQLKDDFQVNAFPTMIFFNNEGKESHRIVGYRTTDKLLAEAQKAVDDKGFGSYVSRYEAGERSTEFINEYISVLYSSRKTDELNKVMIDYLSGIEPQLWLKAENWKLINKCLKDPYSEPIKYIQKNQNKFKAVHGEHAVRMKLYNTFLGGASKFIVEKDGEKVIDQKAYDSYLQMLETLNVDRRDKIKHITDMRNSLIVKDWDTHIKLVEKDIEAMGDKVRYNLLWNYAMRIEQSCDDMKVRSVAAQWCQLAIDNTLGDKSVASFERTLKSLQGARKSVGH